MGGGGRRGRGGGREGGREGEREGGRRRREKESVREREERERREREREKKEKKEEEHERKKKDQRLTDPVDVRGRRGLDRDPQGAREGPGPAEPVEEARPCFLFGFFFPWWCGVL